MTAISLEIVDKRGTFSEPVCNRMARQHYLDIKHLQQRVKLRHINVYRIRK